MTADSPPRELIELAESVGRSMEVKQVPLIIATREDQDRFLDWFHPLIGGSRSSSDSSYPCSTFLDSIGTESYLFLQLVGATSDDLYLMCRDYALDRDVQLETRFGVYNIHPDHRLVLFATTGALNVLAPDLRTVLEKLCIVKFISRDVAERGNDRQERQESGRHPNIDSAVRWCERFYRNRRFLFRGQVQPWPISSTMERITDPNQLELAVGRTQRFIDWLTQEEAHEDAPIGADDALAIAQHHGLPTLLIDLTRSVPVAAFFATAGAEPGQGANGVIYVFNEKELCDNLNFADDDLQDQIGRGVIEPYLDLLRRIRHQQALFIQTRAWLAQDWILAEIPFTHRKPGERIPETSALPREFIYPRPSTLEKRIYAYLLVTAAAGASEPGSLAANGAQLSFDSGGYVTRESRLLARFQAESLPAPYSALDMYAAVLGLTCSHLYAHNVAVTTHVLRATEALNAPTH